MIDFGPVVVRTVTWLVAHAGNRGVIFFGQSLVPGWLVASLGFPAVGMMPALVLTHAQATALRFRAVDGEGGKHLPAATSARDNDTIPLEFASIHDNPCFRYET